MRNPFIGSWRLVSFESHTPTGEVSHPMGPEPTGYLLYTDDGCMSLSIMSGNRTQYASSDPQSGTVAEKAAACETFLAYSGPYEVRSENVITHHSEVALFPNWAGSIKERYYQFEGRRLSLSTPLLLGSRGPQTNRLIWERTGAPGLPTP